MVSIKRIIQDIENIEYCIIRNYEFLSKREKFYDGKDIDILINKKDYVKIKGVLLDKGFKEISSNFASHHKSYILFCKEGIISFHLHIGGVSGKNIFLIKAESILNNRIKEDFYFIPCPAHRYLLILIHVLYNSKEKEKYYKYLTDNVNELDEKIIGDYIPKKYVHQMKKCFHDEDLKKFREIREDFLKHESMNIKKILPRIIFLISSFFYICKRFANPGRVISIIGMDGTGKTTLVKNLDVYFKNSLLRKEIIYTGRGKNNILPIKKMHQIFFRSITEKKSVDTSYSIGKKKNFDLILTLASFIFFTDLLIRYYFKILPSRIKNHLVITDRFGTDIILMNGVPKLLRRFYFSLLPKPDLYIYLYNDVLTLHKRKNHPIDDLKRQKSEFKFIIENCRKKILKIKSEEENQTLNKSLNIIRRLDI